MMHPIENIMKSSIEQIRDIVNVDTIVGTPIAVDNGESVVLPVSKVTLCFVSGGGEYGSATPVRKSADATNNPSEEYSRYPFAGAATVAMNLTPMAFLSVQSDSVNVLPVTYNGSIDRVIDAVPPLLAGIMTKIENYCAKKESQNDCEQ